MRKNWSSDREKLLKFKAEGREISNILRSLEQFTQTFRTIFGDRMLFQLVPGGFVISNKLEQLEFKLEKNIGI